MNTSKFFTLLTLAVAVMCAGCTVSRDAAPPLQGPSELGLGLTITASPDVLSMDGASQSLITVEAHDSNAQLKANVGMRAEIRADGQLVDFGSLSSRNVVTGSNGRATVIYTAPIMVSSDIPKLDIYFTPGGTDANGPFNFGQYVSIRLVPPGVITGPGPNPAFTFTPSAPLAFTNVRFDASTSTAGIGAAIVSYTWDFGDGASATGVVATHRFSSSGMFMVTLTVTDSNGVSASTSQPVVVGDGAAPTADFTFSPATPAVSQDINFNGGLSRPGTGHSIVRWDWNFGSGLNQSGVTVTKAYDSAGTYNVTLTVTDEVGQTAQVTKPVTVGGGGPAVSITSSPSAPLVGTVVRFNSDGTTYFGGATPVSFAWTFGDGGSCSTASFPVGCGTGTAANPTHQYAASGGYTVRLTVTDSLNRTGTATITVTVVPPATPVAAFTYSPASPVSRATGMPVRFDGNASSNPSGAPINNYRWNFGDGTIYSGPPANVPPEGGTFVAPNHTYIADGSYSVTLVVTDTNGLSSTPASATVTVVP